MKIALSTDHAGFSQAASLRHYLEEQGHECIYFGPSSYEPEDDYPDFIKPAAEAVAGGECDAGIIFGGSGQGEAMVANRTKGIRCGVFYGPANVRNTIDAEGSTAKDEYEILRLNRRHNNANILSLGGRFLSEDEAIKAVSIWLQTPFENEDRHLRRINKIDA